MTAEEVIWKPNPSRPKLRLPADTVDTHCHVFGPSENFPYVDDARSNPPPAPKEQLFALHDMLGIDRRVIVQTAFHRFDNSAVADAIAARPKSTLGVALLPPDVSSETLAQLSSQGFRGVRYNYMAHLAPGASPDELHVLGSRLADADWHLVVHMEFGLVAEMAPVLSALPVPVVIDHMARIDAGFGPEQPAFAELLRLVEHDHVWIKVSGCERASRQPYPHRDALPFAQRLMTACPDRVLWGTDWPHPNFDGPPPDDGELADLLTLIAPSEEARHRLLVDNPARLYHFSAAAG